jgi:hypothetical protein
LLSHEEQPRISTRIELNGMENIKRNSEKIPLVTPPAGKVVSVDLRGIYVTRYRYWPIPPGGVTRFSDVLQFPLGLKWPSLKAVPVTVEPPGRPMLKVTVASGAEVQVQKLPSGSGGIGTALPRRTLAPP